MKTGLSVIRYLVNSTYDELNTIEEFENFRRESEVCRNSLALEVGREEAYRKHSDEMYRYIEKYGEGNKQKIKDNLKMIRRITLEIEKSL